MKNKKTYISPKIESFDLDREISLVMASAPPGDPPGDFGVAPSSTPEYPSTLSSDSPFGGTKPDYDNL